MVVLKYMRVKLRVKELCEERGITKVQLSRLAEIQYDTVRGMWNNPTRDVSIVTLEKIARALGVTVLELYTVLDD